MKTLLIIAALCIAPILTGCRTVAVVDHDGPRYVRSGYYHSRPYYYSSSRYHRPYYYGSSRYSRYGRYDGDRYYRSGYYRTGYSGSRYYRGSRGGARVVIRD
jgi:hypothetical protein